MNKIIGLFKTKSHASLEPVSPSNTASVPSINLSIDVHFSTNMKNIHSILLGDQNSLSDKIKCSFSSFSQIDGQNARTLFSIGKVLVQDIVSQRNSSDVKDRQKSLLASMSSAIPYFKSEQSQKSLFIKLQSKLEAFFVLVNRFNAHEPSALDDAAKVATFICDECKEDNELAIAIVYMARCSLVEAMAKASMNISMPTVFSKLTNLGWESDDKCAEELYNVLSLCFEYTVNLFNIKETNCNERLFANGNHTVHFLNYSSCTKEFKAILYKNSKQPIKVQQNKESKESNHVKESKPILYKASDPLIPMKQNKEPDGCHLCGQEIIKSLIYTNSVCGHNYCYYCLQEIADTHSSLKYCFLKRCSKSLNINEVKEFCKQCDEKEKVSEPKKIQAKLDLGLDHKESATPNPVVNVKQNELIECSLCGQQILRHFIYQNPECEHVYCYYCLQELAGTHSGLKFCFLKRCPKPLKIDEVKKFCKQLDEEEKAESSHSGHIHQRVTCSCCDKEVDEKNPIVFTNDKCNHTFCKNWVISSKPTFDGDCFTKNCTETVKIENLIEALKKKGIQTFSVNCNNCSNTVDFCKTFENPSCQHLFCISCTNQLVSTSCLLPYCPAKVNKEKLLLFKEKMLIEEETKSLEQKTVTCPSCNRQLIFSLPKGSKIDYWKCTDCSKISCLQHNGLMSKCLCLCPKCLSDLKGLQSSNAKECSKCPISYCLKCEKQNKIKEICPCLVVQNLKMNIESLQKLSQQCRPGLLGIIPSSLNSYLEIISPAPNFFLIGFLLTQDILSQPVSDESVHLREKIMSSFQSLVEINPFYKARLEKAQLKLEELSLLMNGLSGEGTFNVKDQPSVANFIIESCQHDNGLKETLEWLGRCTLVDYMVSQELDTKIPSMFKKFINENSKSNNIDIEDILSMFCDCFGYKIQLFYQNGSTLNLTNFGQENAVYSAHVLDLSQQDKPLAILYKM